jgi:hypothetical protein
MIGFLQIDRGVQSIDARRLTAQNTSLITMRRQCQLHKRCRGILVALYHLAHRAETHASRLNMRVPSYCQQILQASKSSPSNALLKRTETRPGNVRSRKAIRIMVTRKRHRRSSHSHQSHSQRCARTSRAWTVEKMEDTSRIAMLEVSRLSSLL